MSGDELESSLELSYSSSEFDDERENGIRPFLYEPEASDTSSDESNEEDESAEDESARVGNTEWCSCGLCVSMPTAAESICCTEIDRMQEKMEEGEEVDCITLHPGFQSVCLDVWVLQTAYFSLRQHYGRNAPQGTIQQQYRHTAYRQLVSWCWGWLGNQVRVPLPACAVSKIRSTFTSDNYTGFKYPTLN